MAVTETTALHDLRGHYQDRWRAARRAKADGQKLVGVIGDVPVELIRAAGAFPIQIAASPPGPTPEADIYMDDVVSRETHALFQAAHDGVFADLDLLILDRAQDKLFYYLKEVHRLGHGANFPPLHMFDLMQSRRDCIETYNRQQFDALASRLERLTSRPLDQAALASALAKAEAVRGLQRRLLDHRRRGGLSGVDALQAIGAGKVMETAAYVQALTALLADLDRSGGQIAGPRLFVVSANPLNNTRLHEALEQAGAAVVAEDDVWGSRVVPDHRLAPGASPREAIFQTIWRAAAGAGVFPPEDRRAWFEHNAVADDIDAVVFYIPLTDHLLGWDYPDLKNRVDQAGKPSLLIHDDVDHDPAKVTDQVAQFLATLLEAPR